MSSTRERSSAESDCGRQNRKPNAVPLSERVFNLVLASVLLAYGVTGLLRGGFKVAPPRSNIGLVLQDRPAWLFAAAVFTGAVVLLSVVVDHYDRRDNERWYRMFKRVAVNIGLCLLLASLVSAFYVGLIG